MPAAATVTVRSKTATSKAPADSLLFAANLNAGRLKEMVASAKAVGKLLILEVDSGNEGQHLRYWAMDEIQSPACAMLGYARDVLFSAMGGDEMPHSIQVASDLLHQCVGAFDPKLNLDLRLRVEDNKYLLVLSQPKKDGTDPDERTITVALSTVQAKNLAIPKDTYAAVNLQSFNKVLGGLKRNTDVVTVAISQGELEVAAATSRLKDGWKHSTTTAGRGKGLFGVRFLKSVVAGALATSTFGEIYLAEDQPLRLEAESEDLVVVYYVAGRESMK